MKLDLLVFTQYPLSYAPTRLSQVANLKGLTFQILDYDHVDLENLPRAKAVILREPNPNHKLYAIRDKILNHYKHSSFILNHLSYETWSVLDKITQTKEFEIASIPHIESISQFSILNSQFPKYPYIVKNELGSHGDSVYKIENKNDLDNVLKKHRLEDLLIQEFQTTGFDLRVIVLGGKVLGIMKRTPKEGEFLSNFSQGGRIQRYEDKNDESIIKQIAIKTAKHFKLDYVGVDLMKGNDEQWKVLEVNRACQFKGFEKAVGVNVAKKLIDHIMCYTTGYAQNIGTGRQDKTK